MHTWSLFEKVCGKLVGKFRMLVVQVKGTRLRHCQQNFNDLQHFDGWAFICYGGGVNEHINVLLWNMQSTMWSSSHSSIAYLCMSKFIKLYTSSSIRNGINLYKHSLKLQMERVYSTFMGVKYIHLKLRMTCLFEQIIFHVHGSQYPVP